MSIHLDPEGYQPSKYGLVLLQGLIVLLFLTFALRFWYLQIHKGDEFALKSRENRLRQEKIYAPRGLLRDSHERILAENRPAYGLGLVREDCKDIPSTLAQVSQWTGIDIKELTKRYYQTKRRVKTFEPMILVPDISFELLAQIETNVLRWPGLEIVIRPRRFYPQGPLFAHILGYVADANEKELTANKELSLGDSVGKQGLELILEDSLRGKKGLRQLEVDVAGRNLNKKEIRQPHAGESISLSLDLDLQRVAAEQLKDKAGCIVVMNPDSGKLLALVTSPSFDNNAFAAGLSQKEWATLRDNPYFPLQNRVIQSAYPPGSVWKILMAGLALQEGIDPEETIYCNGKHKLGNATFRCWKKYGHGKVNLEKSLIESCDVYYYELATKLGIDKIEHFAKACGFGHTTGIDLPHERSGLVPSRAWKRKRFGQPWQGGETVITAIGQGFTLVTPVQVATFISSLMNGGKLLKPSLLKNEAPVVKGHTPITPEIAQRLLHAMQATVEGKRGTARRLRRKDVVLGGKTGTAQVVKLKLKKDEGRRKLEEMEYWERDHAWMASWAQKEDERYVVVVMVEHGGHGGSAAGPVAKAIYDHIFAPKQDKQKQ